MGVEQGNVGRATVSKVETDVEPFSDEDIARAKRAGKVLEKQLARLDRERDAVDWQELLNTEVTV